MPSHHNGSGHHLHSEQSEMEAMMEHSTC